MTNRLRPSKNENVIVAHHLGGWFEIDKEIFSHVAKYFKFYLNANPNVSRFMLPDKITQPIFIALKGLFNGDEVDVLRHQIGYFEDQLECLGIITVRINPDTMIVDQEPMVILKCLSKVWRSIIFWPQHESDKAIVPGVSPYHDAFLPNDEQCYFLNLDKLEDLVKSISYYGIKFSHGKFKNHITVVSPCGSFRVRRRHYRKLSDLKFKVFNQYAGDINCVFLPATCSQFAFNNLKLLIETRRCEFDLSLFQEFVTQITILGITIEMEGNLPGRCTPRHRIVARYDKEIEKVVCEWNETFELDKDEEEEDCYGKPAIPITKIQQDDEKRPYQEMEELEEPEANSRIRLRV